MEAYSSRYTTINAVHSGLCWVVSQLRSLPLKAETMVGQKVLPSPLDYVVTLQNWQMHAPNGVRLTLGEAKSILIQHLRSCIPCLSQKHIFEIENGKARNPI